MYKILLVLLSLCSFSLIDGSQLQRTTLPGSPCWSPRAVTAEQVEHTFVQLFIQTLYAKEQEFPRSFFRLKGCLYTSPYEVDIDSLVFDEDGSVLGALVDDFLLNPFPEGRPVSEGINMMILASLVYAKRSNTDRAIHPHELLRDLIGNVLDGKIKSAEAKRFIECTGYDIRTIGASADNDAQTISEWLENLSVDSVVIQELLAIPQDDLCDKIPLSQSKVALEHDHFLRDFNSTLVDPSLLEQFTSEHGQTLKRAHEIEYCPQQMVGPLLYRSATKKKSVVSTLLTLTGRKKSPRDLKPLDNLCELAKDAIYAAPSEFMEKYEKLRELYESNEFNVDEILFDVTVEVAQSTEKLHLRSLGGWLDALLRLEYFPHRAQLLAVLSLIYDNRLYQGTSPYKLLEELMTNYIEGAVSLEDVKLYYTVGSYDIDRIGVDGVVPESLAELLQDELTEDSLRSHKAIELLKMSQSGRSNKDEVLLQLIERILEGEELHSLLKKWIKLVPCASDKVILEQDETTTTLKSYLEEKGCAELIALIDTDSAVPSSSASKISDHTPPLRLTPQSVAQKAHGFSPRRQLFAKSMGRHQFVSSPLAKIETPSRMMILAGRTSRFSTPQSPLVASPAKAADNKRVSSKVSLSKDLETTVRAAQTHKQNNHRQTFEHGHPSVKREKSSSDLSSVKLSGQKAQKKAFFTPQTMLIIGGGVMLGFYLTSKFRPMRGGEVRNADLINGAVIA